MLPQNYKAVWLCEKKRKALEDFIHSEFGLNASIGNVFSEMARFAIDFALANPEEFRKFIDTTFPTSSPPRRRGG